MRKEEKERHITESTNIQLQIEIHHFGNVNVEIYVIGILLSFQKKKKTNSYKQEENIYIRILFRSSMIRKLSITVNKSHSFTIRNGYSL